MKKKVLFGITLLLMVGLLASCGGAKQADLDAVNAAKTVAESQAASLQIQLNNANAAVARAQSDLATADTAKTRAETDLAAAQKSIKDAQTKAASDLSAANSAESTAQAALTRATADLAAAKSALETTQTELTAAIGNCPPGNDQYAGAAEIRNFAPVTTTIPGGYESTINTWIAADENQFPPSDATLFVGSSTITFWYTLADDMAGISVIRRGFGGSTMSALNYYADRIVIPYKPKVIVVYEGENDLSAGSSPEAVLQEYKSFVEKVRGALPETKIYFVSIKPSLLRASQISMQDKANVLISNYSQNCAYLGFIDIRAVMYDSKGNLRRDIFLSDNLHLNRQGYIEWTETIKPLLLNQSLAVGN